jgi:hypothetical protein
LRMLNLRMFMYYLRSLSSSLHSSYLSPLNMSNTSKINGCLSPPISLSLLSCTINDGVRAKY